MPGMEMAYDIPLFLLSIAIAVAASALALYIISRPLVHVGSIVAGGLVMAIAIAGMHYTGMYSMRMAARIEWDYWLVVLSVLIAMAASFAALLVSIRYRHTSGHQWPRTFAGVIMGFAIAGMHYTGMAAATFIHDDSLSIVGTDLLATENLAIAVTTGTLLILGLALLGVAVDRMLAVRTKRAEESERLFGEADKAIAELHREREIRDRLVSALAHDFRTPLAAARMSAQLGARNATDPEAVERHNAKAVEILSRMDQMIQDLLDAHRISAGQSLPLNI
jgi:NO-binding membrane sensor protein with MHYT domain